MNNHHKAIDICKSLTDDFSNIYWIYSNALSFDIIRDLIEKRKNDPIDELILIHLAKNTNSAVLDLLRRFNPRDFIDEIWDELCYNPNPKAFDMIMENINYIESLDRNNEILFYLNLCRNHKAIEFLIKNKDLINWISLSENPYAIDLLLKNPDKIYYPSLCANNHPEAVKIILRILKQEGFNSKKIDYLKLFSNESPDIVQFLNINFDKITRQLNNNIDIICRNKYSMCIIEKMYNLGYKLSNSIWSNESIFRDDIDENIYVNIVENEGYIQTKESS